MNKYFYSGIENGGGGLKSNANSCGLLGDEGGGPSLGIEDWGMRYGSDSDTKILGDDTSGPGFLSGIEDDGPGLLGDDGDGPDYHLGIEDDGM